MATTSAPIRSNGRPAPDAARSASARPPAARRRQLPLVIVGVLLVVGCALAFADASARLSGGGHQVLVVAQPIAPGQVVTPGDLRAVRISNGGGIATVSAGAEPSVLGRPAAVALSPGSVLTRSEVGAGTGLGAGSDEVAVALKPGDYPPDLAAGDRVQVVPVASASQNGATTTTTAGHLVGAVVLAVQAPQAASGSPAVLSLEVPKSDADEVASLAAAGEVSLVERGAGS